MSTVNFLYDVDGKLAKVSKAYIKKACRLRRQLELYQMKEVALLGGNSAFTSIGQVISSNPRTIFPQTDHSNTQLNRKVLLHKLHSKP